MCNGCPQTEAGCCHCTTTGVATRLPRPRRRASLTHGLITVDVAPLATWDANLTASLWALLGSLAQRGLALEFSALPDALPRGRA